MTSKLHRYKDGAWQPMSAADTQIFYDDAWHNPCAGPKTVYHRQNGEWVPFSCGSDLVYFVGYPDTNSFAQRIQAVKTDGSPFDTGNKINAFTDSTYNFHGVNDWRNYFLSRDYNTLYGYRGIGAFTSDRDVYISFDSPGDGIGSDLLFDFTKSSTITPPDAPLWLEFEFSSDGGLRGLYASIGATAPIVIVTYDDSTQNVLYLRDDDGDTVYDSWQDGLTSGIHHGDINETQWHMVRWKLVDFGQAGEIVVDGNTTTLSTFVGTSGRKINSIDIGVPFDNSFGDGWWYTGRIRVGTAPGLGDIVDYFPALDGWPAQSQTEDDPGYDDYPDQRTSGKNYILSMRPTNETFSWNFPSFSPSVHSPAMIAYGTPPLEEIWQLRQDGIDSSATDTPGFPGDRAFQVSVARAGTPPFWLATSVVGQVTGHGLDVLILRSDDSGGNDTTLFRYDFSTASYHLIKSSADYPSAAWEFAGYGFSPSGDKVGWVVFNSTPNLIGIINRDGSGYVEPNLTGYEVNDGVVYWNPLDESEFFYITATSLIKGFTDGTTPPVPIYIPPGDGTVISENVRISPDSTKLAIIANVPASGQPAGSFENTILVMNLDGTDVVDILDAYDRVWVSGSPTFRVISFSWSKDGTQIAFMSEFDPFFTDRPTFWILNLNDLSMVEIVNETDTLQSVFPSSLKWFHGWSETFG